MIFLQKYKNQIVSYNVLRMLIGMIGILLPLILFTGRFIQGGYSNLENSISAYYYSEYRDVFVGFLFVLGFYLLSYTGKDSKENCLATMGCIFSLGVALFPCNNDYLLIRILHLVSAGSLFGMFAIFSLWLFRRSFFNKELNIIQKRINRVYIITGIILIISILGLIIITAIQAEEFKNKIKPVFLLESVGLITFAYAWLTRAHFLWRDKSEYRNRFYMFIPL